MDRTADYDFELPAERIAQVPSDARTDSRLLVLTDGAPADTRFAEVGAHLPPRSVVVVNDTRVIFARVRGRKPTGGAVELLFVEPLAGGSWRCLANASKPMRAGQRIEVLDAAGEPTGDHVDIAAKNDDGSVEVTVETEVLAFLERVGELPLPPYIDRPGGPTDADRTRYQTVFAEHAGAVAAPTAGLHFSRALKDALTDAGHTFAPITLHVGPGTFRPVRADRVDDHRLDVERYHIPESTAELVGSGRPVVAVGTTSVRTLEAAASADRTVTAGWGATDLFIRPGFRFRVIDRLITNFHLPRSTLLMLVAAFAGYDRTLAAYRHAVAGDYRFYSYGDAMLVCPQGATS